MKRSVYKSDVVVSHLENEVEEQIEERSMHNLEIEEQSIKVLNQNTPLEVLIENAEKIWQKHTKNAHQSSIGNPFKSLVSKNKKRFEWDGYDLDLAYITDNIIAMGFPSENLESIYRNNMEEVERFLNEKHENHYRVYNLCKEKKYPKTHFNGNVVELPFEDHYPPNFEILYRFCADAKEWLDKDKNNVIAVHCKAGKGRTGTVISCFLMYTGLFSNSETSMRYYGIMRTVDSKGVTIPSQIRYVGYFQKLLKIGLNYADYLKLEVRVKIVKIKVSPVPQINFLGGCTPWVSIMNRHNIYKSKYYLQLVTFKQQQSFELAVQHKFCLKEDVIIHFFSKKFLNKSQQFMHVCFNVNFVSEYMIIKGNQIDGVKNDSRFNKNTCIQIWFSSDKFANL